MTSKTSSKHTPGPRCNQFERASCPVHAPPTMDELLAFVRKVARPTDLLNLHGAGARALLARVDGGES